MYYSMHYNEGQRKHPQWLNTIIDSLLWVLQLIRASGIHMSLIMPSIYQAALP